jgi:hypothetical protein
VANQAGAAAAAAAAGPAPWLPLAAAARVSSVPRPGPSRLEAFRKSAWFGVVADAVDQGEALVGVGSQRGDVRLSERLDRRGPVIARVEQLDPGHGQAGEQPDEGEKAGHRRDHQAGVERPVVRRVSHRWALSSTRPTTTATMIARMGSAVAWPSGAKINLGQAILCATAGVGRLIPGPAAIV